MPLAIGDRIIERIHIVDDDPAARIGFGYSVVDTDLTPVFQDAPIMNLDDFIASIDSDTDAVLCDYHLRKRAAYAAFDGDAVIAACYRARIPGLLCTTFSDIGLTLNRHHLRFIPSLLRTSSPEPDAVIQALEVCAAEIAGAFHPKRRPWRTLVRIVEIDEDGGYFYVVIPAWSSQQKVRIDQDEIPEGIKRVLNAGQRLHAQVNIGANSFEELYFDGWEAE